MFVTILLNHGLEFQRFKNLNFVCNRCHDFMILYLNQGDMAILIVSLINNMTLLNLKQY